MAKSLIQPLGRLSTLTRLFILVTGVVALSGCQQADPSAAQKTLSLIQTNEALRLENRVLREKLYESETRRLRATQPDLGFNYPLQSTPSQARPWFPALENRVANPGVESAERVNAEQMRRYREYWRIHLKEPRGMAVPAFSPSEP